MFLGIQDMVDGVSRVVENALGASLLDIAIQIGSTLLLVVIVKIFFWSRITDFIKKRKDIMDEEFTSAKKANEEAKVLQEAKDKEYQDIKAKSKGYIEKAKLRGEEEKNNIVSKARKEAKQIITQAEKEVLLDQRKAKTEIQKEAVSLATMMASKIIEAELDENKYQDLAVKNIEESENI